MLAAGTVVTGTGPLAGAGAVPRYHLPLTGVTQFHSDIGWLLGGLTVPLVVGLRLTRAPARVMRLGWLLLGLLGAQGAIGYTQYFTGLPAGLVWVHVTGSLLIWIAALRLMFAVRDRGPLISRRRKAPAGRLPRPSRRPSPRRPADGRHPGGPARPGPVRSGMVAEAAVPVPRPRRGSAARPGRAKNESRAIAISVSSSWLRSSNRGHVDQAPLGPLMDTAPARSRPAGSRSWHGPPSGRWCGAPTAGPGGGRAACESIRRSASVTTPAVW